jgi:predicted RNA-binding protein YlqC (UPF0109 family)
VSTDYVDLVEYIVKNIVDKPDSVVVEAVQGRGRSETVEIRLDPVDVGRVIGKGGRNIEAIRSLVKASAIKEHHRVNVEVISEEVAPAEGYGDEPEVSAAEAEAEAEPGQDVTVGDGVEAEAPGDGRPEPVEG